MSSLISLTVPSLLNLLDPLAVFTSPGPILFKLGFLEIRWYGFLIASSVLIGVFLSQNLAQRRGIDPDLVSDMVMWLVIAALPSARLYYVAFQWQNYASRPQDILAIWQGGIAIHGAILGGAAAGWIFCKIKQISFWLMADFIAPSLILGQAIGRWGNFFNSEAFGSPTDLPWKLFIPLRNRPPGLQDVAYYHPTFLYESLWNVGVFALLLWLTFKGLNRGAKPKPGTVFLTYMVTYSLGRVWIEGLRLDSLMFGPLRIAQVISLLGMLLGGFGLYWLYKMDRNLPDTVPATEVVSSPSDVPQ